jgi:hypothetical protein
MPYHTSFSVQPVRKIAETTTTPVIEEGTIPSGFTGKYIAD